MKITTKGQVTIPKRLREKYDLAPESEVTFEPVENGVLMRRATTREAAIGRMPLLTRGTLYATPANFLLCR